MARAWRNKYSFRDWTDAEYMAKWKANCTINPDTGCWEWNGFRHAYITGRRTLPGVGYALTGYRGKSVRVHRQVLALKLGRPLAKGEVTRHSCDVPYCINPDHVSLGTQKQNFDEMTERGRNAWASRTHCANGHEYTPENTRMTVTKRRRGRQGSNYVHRVCLTCESINHARAYQRRRGALPQGVKHDIR